MFSIMNYAPVICNHCPPHLQGWAGDSGANLCGSDLFSCLAVPYKCRASDVMQIYPCGIYFYKEQSYMTISRSPECWAFSRALMAEKLLSPLFPVGGGAVVTNDWCIMYVPVVFRRILSDWITRRNVLQKKEKILQWDNSSAVFLYHCQTSLIFLMRCQKTDSWYKDAYACP